MTYSNLNLLNNWNQSTTDSWQAYLNSLNKGPNLATPPDGLPNNQLRKDVGPALQQQGLKFASDSADTFEASTDAIYHFFDLSPIRFDGFAWIDWTGAGDNDDSSDITDISAFTTGATFATSTAPYEGIANNLNDAVDDTAEVITQPTHFSNPDLMQAAMIDTPASTTTPSRPLGSPHPITAFNGFSAVASAAGPTGYFMSNLLNKPTPDSNTASDLNSGGSTGLPTPIFDAAYGPGAITYPVAFPNTTLTAVEVAKSDLLSTFNALGIELGPVEKTEVPTDNPPAKEGSTLVNVLDGGSVYLTDGKPLNVILAVNADNATADASIGDLSTAVIKTIEQADTSSSVLSQVSVYGPDDQLMPVIQPIVTLVQNTINMLTGPFIRR